MVGHKASLKSMMSIKSIHSRFVLCSSHFITGTIENSRENTYRVEIEKPPGLFIYLIRGIPRPPFGISTELEKSAPWPGFVDLSKPSKHYSPGQQTCLTTIMAVSGRRKSLPSTYLIVRRKSCPYPVEKIAISIAFWGRCLNYRAEGSVVDAPLRQIEHIPS